MAIHISIRYSGFYIGFTCVKKFLLYQKEISKMTLGLCRKLTGSFIEETSSLR